MNSTHNQSLFMETPTAAPVGLCPMSAATAFACAVLAGALTFCLYESRQSVASPMTEGSTFAENLPDYCRVIKRHTYGDIAPYRRNMYWRIARNWKVDPKENSAIVLSINLDQNGKLLEQQIVQSSGSAEEDRLAARAIANTEFAPLPTWFKRKNLELKIPMCKIQQLIRVPTECYSGSIDVCIEKNRA